MISHGLSERRSLRVIGVSASAYRYEPAQDRNCALKEKIVALALQNIEDTEPSRNQHPATTSGIAAMALA
jgi:hypothetical protein